MLPECHFHSSRSHAKRCPLSWFLQCISSLTRPLSAMVTWGCRGCSRLSSRCSRIVPKSTFGFSSPRNAPENPMVNATANIDRWSWASRFPFPSISIQSPSIKTLLGVRGFSGRNTFLDATSSNNSEHGIVPVLVPILFLDQVVSAVCHLWPVPKLWCTHPPKCSRETLTTNSQILHHVHSSPSLNKHQSIRLSKEEGGTLPPSVLPPLFENARHLTPEQGMTKPTTDSGEENEIWHTITLH
jgi:hypothetical protein